MDRFIPSKSTPWQRTLMYYRSVELLIELAERAMDGETAAEYELVKAGATLRAAAARLSARKKGGSNG
jgi:hypothetical protein